MPAVSRLLIALFATLGIAGCMNMILPEMPHRKFGQIASGILITVALLWCGEE